MIGFVFNYQDESNMYMFRWNLQSPTGRTLSKYENGTETILASDDIPYIQNDWYHADIYSIDGNIVLTIDGVEIFSLTDNTFETGKVSLYCWGNQSAYFDNFRVECPGAPVELNVLLEGPFNGTEMNTDLNGNPELDEGLSLSNPYTVAPWNHTGNEAVLSFSDPDVVDWLLVDFRDATSAAAAIPATSIGTKAALLLSDGMVVSPYGGLPLYLNASISDNLFVVVKHRNHLGVLSAIPLTEMGGTYFYDFTNGPGQAYGTDAQINLGGGIYGIFAGDADASGTINNDDKNIDWENESGSSGYIQSDLNLDGQANNLDKNDFWLPNYLKSDQLP